MSTGRNTRNGWLAAALLCAVRLHAGGAAENLVKNSGFEEDAPGRPPAGYDLWRGDPSGAGAVDGAVGYKSRQAVRSCGASNLVWQYTVDVRPGERYLVEALCRQEGLGTATMSVYWKDADGKWNWPAGMRHEPYKPFDGPWRKAIARVQVPDQGVAQLTVLLGVENQVTADDAAWFDEVGIRKLPPKKSAFLWAYANVHPLPPPPVIPEDYRLGKSQSEVFDTLRMACFRYAAISEEQASAEMRLIRDQGYNAILTEGQRYLFVEDKPEPEPSMHDITVGSLPYPQNVKHTKIVADAAHRLGLKVYLHLTASLVTELFTKEHPDWMAISLKDGQKDRIWGVPWACLNNPEYINLFYQRLDNLVKESRADGLMVDETVQLVNFCGCRWCRDKFKRDLGADMPPQGGDWVGNMDSPDYRRFMAWRIETFKEVNRRNKEILRKHTPDGELLSYYAVPTFEKAWTDHGLSLESLSGLAATMGWEAIDWYTNADGLEDNYSNWLLGIADLKLVRAISEIGSGSIFSISNPHSNSHLYLEWLVGLSQGGHRYWTSWAAPEIKSNRVALVQWEMKNENFLAGLRSSADTAVLLSERNNNLHTRATGRINRQNSFAAVCNSLTLAQLPYKVITDVDLKRSDLSRVKTLVMLNVGLLSDADASRLRKFVKKGGTLIASAETSLYDEQGVQRPNFALADLFGCDFRQAVKGGATLVLNQTHPLLGSAAGEIGHPDDHFVVEPKAKRGATVLGLLRRPGATDVPGLLVNTYGKGRVVYFAGHPETSLFVAEVNGVAITPRDPCGMPRDPAMAALFRNLVANSGRTTAIDNLPPGVVVETYAHAYKGAEGMQMHLLNLAGVLPDVTKGTPDRLFPDLKELLPDPAKPIEVTVRNKKIRSAYMLSPDFDGLYELPIERKGDAVICRFPAFARYLIVYFNTGDTQALQQLANIPVRTGQPVIKIIEPQK